METKICRACKESRPLTDFHKDRTQSDGHKGLCRACRSGQDRGKKSISKQALNKPDERTPEQRLRHTAYQRALRMLVEMHPREFHQLVAKELVNLGGEKRWHAIAG